MSNTIIEKALRMTNDTINKIGAGYDPAPAIQTFVKKMKQYANEAHANNEFDLYNEIQNQVGEIKEVELGASSDVAIDSWAEKSVVRNDALEALRRFSKTWSKASQVSNSKSLSGYRFTIGETVQVKNSKRIGKIVGMRRQNGTGKQVYQVRLVNNDSTKEFGVNEITRYVTNTK